MPAAKVLIVDDSPDIRMIIKAFLEPWHLKVSEACDGKDGLSQTKENRYDIVFVDLIMPEMDGLQFVQELRQLERSQSRMPSFVVVVSGSVDKDEFIKVKLAGANACLSKPVGEKEIRQILDQVPV